jgi:hypothetical protein
VYNFKDIFLEEAGKENNTTGHLSEKYSPGRSGDRVTGLRYFIVFLSPYGQIAYFENNLK